MGSVVSYFKRIFTAESIPDKYHTLEELNKAITDSGAREGCNLIFGIDFTASNEEKGKLTNGGRNLHALYSTYPEQMNQYELAILLLIRGLKKYDEDDLIPSYGFGDIICKDRKIFSLSEDGDEIRGIDNVLNKYRETVEKFDSGKLTMSGPTSFSPIINKAIEIVKEKGGYHVLIIIADGQVSNEQETIDTIVKASKYSLSIITIGLGDGPWDVMEKFDDRIPERDFDNFQFVNFSKYLDSKQLGVIDYRMTDKFILDTLMEIPSQYQKIKQLGLIRPGEVEQKLEFKHRNKSKDIEKDPKYLREKPKYSGEEYFSSSYIVNPTAPPGGPHIMH